MSTNFFPKYFCHILDPSPSGAKTCPNMVKNIKKVYTELKNDILMWLITFLDWYWWVLPFSQIFLTPSWPWWTKSKSNHLWIWILELYTYVFYTSIGHLQKIPTWHRKDYSTLVRMWKLLFDARNLNYIISLYQFKTLRSLARKGNRVCVYIGIEYISLFNWWF